MKTLNAQQISLNAEIVGTLDAADALKVLISQHRMLMAPAYTFDGPRPVRTREQTAALAMVRILREAYAAMRAYARDLQAEYDTLAVMVDA